MITPECTDGPNDCAQDAWEDMNRFVAYQGVFVREAIYRSDEADCGFIGTRMVRPTG